MVSACFANVLQVASFVLMFPTTQPPPWNQVVTGKGPLPSGW